MAYEKIKNILLRIFLACVSWLQSENLDPTSPMDGPSIRPSETQINSEGSPEPGPEGEEPSTPHTEEEEELNLRPVVIVSDNVYTTEKDRNAELNLVSLLVKKGVDARAYDIIGPSARLKVQVDPTTPTNALIIERAGGSDAGVMLEMAGNWFNGIKGNKLVFIWLCCGALTITGLSWLPRAHDDNYSPASFTGIANPDQFLKNHGYKFIETDDLNLVADAIYQILLENQEGEQKQPFTGYIRIPGYWRYKQIKNGWCGNAVFQLIFSTWDINIDQETSGEVAGTNINGTDHDGLQLIINYINSLYNRNFKLEFRPCTQTGINGIAKLISEGKRPFLEIRTKDPYSDWLFPGYDGDWFHYISIIGVNLDDNTVTYEDPDRSINTVPWETIAFAVGLVAHNSLGLVWE